MKRPAFSVGWLFALLIACLCFLPDQLQIARTTGEALLYAAQSPASITVYITRTGEKYHRDGCRYLSQTKIAVSLRDAVKNGFGPCSVCKPPRIE